MVEQEYRPSSEEVESSSGADRMVVGARKNEDGSWDFSQAMISMTGEEVEAAVERERQRQDVINGKISHQIASNPEAYVDVVQARKYWGQKYDEAGSGTRMEMQINEIYAQRYESCAEDARLRMQELEKALNEAESEAEKQALLVQIVEERDTAEYFRNEAHVRRGY